MRLGDLPFRGKRNMSWDCLSKIEFFRFETRGAPL